MKYKVMYTAGAKKDLRDIFRYISEELLAPENAVGQTKRIMTAIRKLDAMPNRNRLYEEEPWSWNISTRASLSACDGIFAHVCVVSNSG